MKYGYMVGILMVLSVQSVPVSAFDRGNIAATCHKNVWFNAPAEYYVCVEIIVGQDGSGNYYLEHMYGVTPNSVLNLFSSNKRQICPSVGRTRPVAKIKLFPPEAIKGNLCDESYLE